MHVQKLDGFLDHVMSEGLIGDGTVAPDVSKVSMQLFAGYKCYSLFVSSLFNITVPPFSKELFGHLESVLLRL